MTVPAGRFYSASELMAIIVADDRANACARRANDRRNARRRSERAEGRDERMREAVRAIMADAAATLLRSEPVRAKAPAPITGERGIIDVRPLPAGSPFSDFLAIYGGSSSYSYRDLVSQRRAAPLVMARQIAMWVGIRCYGLSYPKVGKALSRDHTTALHGVRKIDALIAERGLTVPGDPMAAALYLNRELGGAQ